MTDIEAEVAKIVSVIESVPGTDNVYGEPITATDRETAEVARGVEVGEVLQSWEVFANPIEAHEGASGYQRTRARVRIEARYCHKDRDPASLSTFRGLVASVMRALANPETGLPDIASPGIEVEEGPEVLRRLPTGQSAWYCAFGFETLGLENT